MYLSRCDSCQSKGKKNILHKSIFLSHELYQSHCKVASYSSQSVALLPSSMKTLRQRYQAFIGTTSSENLQGGEQKNTPVFQRTVIRPVQNGITNTGDNELSTNRNVRTSM